MNMVLAITEITHTLYGALLQDPSNVGCSTVSLENVAEDFQYRRSLL